MKDKWKVTKGYGWDLNGINIVGKECIAGNKIEDAAPIAWSASQWASMLWKKKQKQIIKNKDYKY